MLIWIQVFSCFVQADGCRKFYVFINKNVPTGINNRAVSMHVGVVLLYLIGLVCFYITFIRRIESVDPQEFLIEITIKAGLSSLSQVALSYLFYELC